MVKSTADGFLRLHCLGHGSRLDNFIYKLVFIATLLTKIAASSAAANKRANDKCKKFEGMAADKRGEFSAFVMERDTCAAAARR